MRIVLQLEKNFIRRAKLRAKKARLTLEQWLVKFLEHNEPSADSVSMKEELRNNGR